ncbi:MAG: hypothetical protein P8Y92_08975 [Halioglobus sp.]|jgi:hypothetical protein
MRAWFKKSLGDAMLAGTELDRIQALLFAAYSTAGNPEELAAFLRHESDGRLHCEVMIYFSPGFASVATAVEAETCERPAPDGLSVLVGSEHSQLTLLNGPVS